MVGQQAATLAHTLARSEHPRGGLLVDSYGRRIRNLRVSVTDRCNFRCVYCMPAEGLAWLPKGDILTYEEIERLVRIALRIGVEEIRLTGGEPLVRKDLPELVRRLASLQGLKSLSLTTNGYLLKEQARGLAEAGLRRINVSLDTLDHEKFYTLTRRDSLPKVLEGLAEIERYPQVAPIKINAVAIRGLARARCSRSRGWRGASPTRCAGSSICRSTRTRPGPRTTC